MVAGVVEKFSQSAGLMVFFVLFALVFWLGGLVAVRITEQFVHT